MRIASLVCSLAVAGSSALAGTAAAEAMRITPGLWQFNSETRMAGEVTPHEATQCVALSELTPEAFMQQFPECKTESLEMSATSMSWKIRCRNEDGKLKGEGQFTSSGSTLEGSVKATMTLKGGQPLGLEQTWSAKRVGDCPETAPDAPLPKSE